MSLRPTPLVSIGSLGYHDDSTSQKVALSCFKLCCDYSYWINLTNVHDLPGRGRGVGSKRAKPKEKDFIQDIFSKVKRKTEQVIYGCLHYITTTKTLSLENSRTERKIKKTKQIFLWIDRLHNRKVMNPQERIVTQPVNSQHWWSLSDLDKLFASWIFLIFSVSFGIFYNKCLCQSRWKTFLVTTTLEMFQLIFSAIPTLRRMYKNKHIAILKGYHSIKVSSTPV